MLRVKKELSFAEINAKTWLSPREVELIFNISQSSLAKRRMAQNQRNAIPYSKFSRFIRYNKKLIEEWLEEHQVQGN